VYNLSIDRQRIYFALEVKRIEPGVNKIKGVVKAEGRAEKEKRSTYHSYRMMYPHQASSV
jgi:hypothetical protein